MDTRCPPVGNAGAHNEGMNTASHKAATPEYAGLIRDAWASTGRANHHLFSAGETLVFQKWAQLSEPAQKLFGRLIFRVPKARPWSTFDLPFEIGDEICGAALGYWSHRILPVHKLIPEFTKAELKAVLQQQGESIAGQKHDLQTRARQYPSAIREIRRFSLRHRPLFARLLRLHLGRAHRWAKAWELHSLGKRSYWSGTRSVAKPLYFRRSQMLSAEKAWQTGQDSTADLSAMWPVALSALQTEEESPRHRLSPAQSWRIAIRQSLNRSALVREDVPFEQILQATSDHEPGAVGSLFRPIVESLLTSHAPQRALALIEQFDLRLPLHLRISLRATHKRLARQTGHAALPPIILNRPPVRRIRLPSAPTPPHANRPHYQIQNASVTAENAVIHAIQSTGRTVVFTENVLWQHLFISLMADIWMKPVAGMLTGPSTSRPLDFGLSAFYQRRRNAFHERLAQIENGAVHSLLHQNLDRFKGVRIGPITIGAWNTEHLVDIANFLPVPFLTRSLRHLLAQPEPGFTGFPDLLLYPIFDQADSRTGLSHAIPSRLPIDHLWIEVKGPNDRAHPAQQAWHHRFLDWAEKVEIWELRPSLVTQSP